MCILFPSQTSERTRHSARPQAKCGFSSIQQVSYFPPRKSGQFPCSAVTLCVQFFGLAIWLLYLFFLWCSICWLTCQRAMACLVFSIDCSTIPSTGVLWRQHKVWRYGWWRCGHRLHRAYATKSRWQQRKTVHRPIICRNSRKSFSCLWYRPRQFSQ